MPEKEPAPLLNHDLDSEVGGQSGDQLLGLLHLNESVATLPLAGLVRSQVGDEMRHRIAFLAQLQTPRGSLEVSVMLKEETVRLSAEARADPDQDPLPSARY